MPFKTGLVKGSVVKDREWVTSIPDDRGKSTDIIGFAKNLATDSTFSATSNDYSQNHLPNFISRPLSISQDDI